MLHFQFLILDKITFLQLIEFGSILYENISKLIFTFTLKNIYIYIKVNLSNRGDNKSYTDLLGICNLYVK